jgi:hypothetical protein
MMMPRRRFLSLAAAGAVASLHRVARAQPRPTIDVKKLGAFGNGKQSDLRQIRRACELALEHPSGATIYFPPGEYYLGTALGADLVAITNLKNVRFVGERATLSCRSAGTTPTMFMLTSTSNVTIEGLAFRDSGADLENRKGAYAIGFANEGPARGPENTVIRDCTFESLLGAVVADNEQRRPGGRAGGIALTDLSVKACYYGFNFADNADDLTGRGLVCDDVHRSYFPYGVSRHDVELDTRNNASGFTDILIKCYRGDTIDVRVKAKCRAKRGGDAIVALDHQHEQGRGTMRNIRLDLDIDDVDCRLETAILIRSFTPNARVESSTTNRWEQIYIDGDIRLCERTRLFEIATVAKTTGTLEIGSRLAKNARLPRSFPGFRVTNG